MKVRKTLLYTGIVFALGMSANATAGVAPWDINLLDNPGFEDPLNGDWTESDAVRHEGPGPYVRTGTWSARMYDNDDDEGNMYQEVDVSDCSPYGKGEYGVEGYSKGVEPAWDESVLAVAFDNNPAWSDRDDGAQWFALGNQDYIPADATTAKVTISGEDDGGGSLDGAEVYWDDMWFGLDCVTDFMKVSGKVQGTEESPRGQYSFNGVFFNQESDSDGADAQGDLYVNYKSEKFSCVFEAEEDGGDIQYGTEDGFEYACIETTYQCEGSEDYSGDAEVCIILGTGGPEGPEKDKDRGQICIGADDSAVDVQGDGYEGCAVLDKGNTDMMPPEPEV